MIRRYTGVKDFSHRQGHVAILLEVLREGGEVSRVYPPVGVEVIQAGGVGPPPSEEGHSARGAHCLLGKGILEEEAVGCQLIDVWGLHCLIPVTAQGRAQVIHNDEQDIRSICGRVDLRCGFQVGAGEAQDQAEPKQGPARRQQHLFFGAAAPEAEGKTH